MRLDLLGEQQQWGSGDAGAQCVVSSVSIRLVQASRRCSLTKAGRSLARFGWLLQAGACPAACCAQRRNTCGGRSQRSRSP
jgi:hypothetical protein